CCQHALLFCVLSVSILVFFVFFFQAEDGIRDRNVTGVQTCALPIYAFSSFTARSASILRFTSTPATFSPCINWLYEISFKRAAALIRAIHNLRKSRFL